MLGRWALGRTPLAAGDIAYLVPPGQVIPPPIPGGTASYRYAIQRGGYPLGWQSLAGGVAPPGNPGGGAVLVPQPELGVMRILGWWPDTDSVSLLRVDDNGATVTPVRGAYPRAVVEPTRRNYVANPSATAGLNGWLPGAGNPTLSRLTDEPTPRGTALRGSIAADGSAGLVVPVAFPGAQRTHTVSLALRLSARPSGFTVTVDWVGADGVAISTGTASLTADEINRSVARFGRQVLSLQPPQNAASLSARFTAAGLPAGATLDVTAVCWESGITDGDYVDGDTLGGTWTGTPGLSTSVVAPVLPIDDGECPLDRPVSYILSQPALVGGRIESADAVLYSHRRAWLTHPATPHTPMRCHPTEAPVLTYPVVQGTFRAIDSRTPVTVSHQRGAPTGTLVLDCASFAARDALLDYLADGAPVLLRGPLAYGYADMWLAVGDVEVDPDAKPAPTEPRLVSLPFAATDAPAQADRLAPAQ